MQSPRVDYVLTWDLDKSSGDSIVRMNMVLIGVKGEGRCCRRTTSVSDISIVSSHWAHNAVATLSQRQWRWFNFVTTSCAQWAPIIYPHTPTLDVCKSISSIMCNLSFAADLNYYNYELIQLHFQALYLGCGSLKFTWIRDIQVRTYMSVRETR